MMTSFAKAVLARTTKLEPCPSRKSHSVQNGAGASRIAPRRSSTRRSAAAALSGGQGLELVAAAAAKGARQRPGCDYAASNQEKLLGSLERPARRAVIAQSKDEPEADAAVEEQVEPPKPAKKPRLPALDSIRFFLISYIATGHFVTFGTRDPFVIKLFAQINVVVGAFFVLSGYVAAYTATELGKYEASPRVRPAATYILSRISGYYPLHLLVTLIFAPMFLFVDLKYNGPIKTAFHAFLNLTLTQAWFPMSAEIWNAPTWFLSALTFAMVVMPFALPVIAAFRLKALRQSMVCLTATSLVMKLAYSYDLNAWSIMEGVTSPRFHPNPAFFNITRFNPFPALIEVLIGAVACRMIMVETSIDSESDAGESSPPSPLVPLLGMIGIIVGRACGWIQMNDMITRAAFFIPLFTIFLMRLHRLTVSKTSPVAGLTKALAWKPLVEMGGISFAIYVVHGPIGQVFYKRAVAKLLFGQVMGLEFYPIFNVIVLATAFAVHKLFVTNKAVNDVNKAIVKKMSAWFA